MPRDHAPGTPGRLIGRVVAGKYHFVFVGGETGPDPELWFAYGAERQNAAALPEEAMMNQFTVRGRLPGLNELIEANRLNKYAGAAMKKEADALIRLCIRSAMARGECWPVRDQCAVLFYWFERSHRRDLDNIFSAKKFILDAMRAEGLIKNDSQRYVGALADRFTLADDDGVTVVIERLKEGANHGQEGL